MTGRWVFAGIAPFALLLVTCSRAPAPWERPALQAEAALRGPDLDLRGRVTFVRPRDREVGTLQFDVTRDGQLHNATLLASGKTTAFTDGAPRPMTEVEARALDVLAALFAWPGRPGERRVEGGAAIVRMPAGDYALTILEEASPDPHHRGR